MKLIDMMKLDKEEKAGFYIVIFMLAVLIIYVFIVKIYDADSKNIAEEYCSSRMNGTLVNSILDLRNFVLNRDVPKGYGILTCESVINETFSREVFYIKTT